MPGYAGPKSYDVSLNTKLRVRMTIMSDETNLEYNKPVKKGPKRHVLGLEVSIFEKVVFSIFLLIY